MQVKNTYCGNRDCGKALIGTQKVYCSMACRNVGRVQNQTHCKRGHEFTPENTWLNKQGKRRCRICFRHNKQAQRDRGPGRDYELRYKYGITLEDYERMVKGQNGCCSGCGIARPSLNVDHDHATGMIRGLLCGNCNRAIGLAGDSPETLRRLANYLEIGVVTDR